MDLSQILTSANVNPGQVDQLVQDGWTVEHFALIADSIEDFDAAINDFSRRQISTGACLPSLSLEALPVPSGTIRAEQL